MKRKWTDAKQADRCNAVITLKDGTTADCGRKATHGAYCWQHAAIGPHERGERKCA